MKSVAPACRSGVVHVLNNAAVPYRADPYRAGSVSSAGCVLTGSADGAGAKTGVSSGAPEKWAATLSSTSCPMAVRVSMVALAR